METRQDGASAAGPRECYIAIPDHSPEWGKGASDPGWLMAWSLKHGADAEAEGWGKSNIPHKVSKFREVVQESQPATAPAAQGEAPKSREAVAKYLCESFPPDDRWKGQWDRMDENAKDQWRWYADRILALAQPPADPSQGMREAVPTGWVAEVEQILIDEYATSGRFECGNVAERIVKALAALSRSQEAPKPVPMPADRNHVYWLVWAARQMVLACSTRDADFAAAQDQAKYLGTLLAKYFAHIPDPVGSKAIGQAPAKEGGAA